MVSFFLSARHRNLMHLESIKNIEVVNQLDERSPMIVADPDQLCQVFNNLIINAIQAMPEDGQLTINSKINLKWVEISITDTGIGISEENLTNIFKPLFTTKANGIGLGLAIIKTLVDDIEVQFKFKVKWEWDPLSQ